MGAKKFRNRVKNYQVVCTLLIGTSLLGTSYAYWAETLSIEANITTGKIEVDVEQARDAHEVGNAPCNSNGGQSPIGYTLTNTGTVPVVISLSDISGEDITIYKITGDRDNWYEDRMQLQIDRDDLNQNVSSCNKKCTVPSDMNLFDLIATKLVIQDGKSDGKKEAIVGVDESIDISFDNNAHLEEVIGLLNPKENGNGSTTGGILIRVNMIVKYNGWNKEIVLEIPIKHGNMKELDLGLVGGNGGINLLPILPPIEVPEVLPAPEEKPEGPEMKPTPPVEGPEVLPVPGEKPEEPEEKPLPPIEVPEVLPDPEEKPEEPETSPTPLPIEKPEEIPDPEEKPEEPETSPTLPPIEESEVIPDPEEKPEEPETSPTPPPIEVPEVIPDSEEKSEEPESLPETDDIQEEAAVD